jgi:hypothetical protein
MTLEVCFSEMATSFALQVVFVFAPSLWNTKHLERKGQKGETRTLSRFARPDHIKKANINSQHCVEYETNHNQTKQISKAVAC